MKVVLFGSRGFLGGHFLRLFPDALCPQIDITDRDAVVKVLDEQKPDLLINAAGRTGRPNVDWCEEHKLETLRSNVSGPLVLLEECGKRGTYWVQLGSGCIYTGDNAGEGFSEEDPPNFTGSFYAKTKGWIDQMLKSIVESESGKYRVLVLRLRMPFDDSLHPRSLLSKIIRYDRVLDMKNSLTYLPDFLNAMSALVEKGKTGLYNIVNPGAISPYDIVCLYKKFVQEKHTFERLTLEDLPGVVKAGRSNCILNSGKLEKEGISMRPVEEAVERALRARGE